LDAKTLRVERSFPPGRVFGMAPDDRTAAIGREDGSVAFLDLRSGQVMAAKGRHTGPVEGVGFSPDGSTLVTTGEDRNVMVWDVRTRSIVEVLAGHSGGAFGPVFDPQGDTAFTVGLDGKVLAWDLTGDRRIGRPFTFARASHVSRAVDFENIASSSFRFEVALSPDASVLVFSSDTGEVIAKDRASNEALWRTDPWSKGRVASLASRDWLFGYGTGDLVKSLAFSPDGSRVAEGGQNQEVVLIDATSGDVIRRLPASDYGWVNGVTFAEDGTLITASDDGRAVLWDIGSGEPLWEYRLVDELEKGSAPTDWEEGVGRAEISPDGTRLAATTIGFGEGFTAQLFVYDLATRAPAWRTSVDRWSAVFDWSPDSASIATGGSQSGDLRLWDAKGGRRLGEPVHASAGFLQTVLFAQDGSLIVTAGTDGTVRLYDSPTLKQVGASLPAIKSHTTFAFPLLDHRSLLALSDIGRGWVWALDPARWAEQACLVANRELTPSEWEQFLPGRPYDPACRT
jgi:WD40 repeat protein